MPQGSVDALLFLTSAACHGVFGAPPHRPITEGSPLGWVGATADQANKQLMNYFFEKLGGLLVPDIFSFPL